MTLIDSRWTFEPADPEVGIFGEAVYHEPCQDGDEPVEAVEQPASVVPDGRHWVKITRTFRCPCGAEVQAVEQYPARDFAEPGRE